VFVLVLAVGALALRRLGEDQAGEEAIPLEEDPMYTGERRGLGWALLHLVGMLIAAPIALINFNVKALDGLASFGRTPEEDRQLESGETAMTSSSGGD